MPKLSIREVQTKKFLWLNVISPDRKEINALRERFGFEMSDLETCLPPLQWTKMIERPNYIFVVLLFPFYDKAIRTIKSAEVDIFITKDTVITLHNNQLAQIEKMFNSCLNDTDGNICRLSDTGEFIFDLMNAMFESLAPIILHLSNTIDETENEMFEKFEKGIIKDILLIKTNTVNMKKALSGKALIIRRLSAMNDRFFNSKTINLRAITASNYVQEIHEVLSSYKETIDAFHETAVSLLNYRVSEVMKTLTIFSVIVFPLTLLAAIFGMNAQWMPLIDDPLGFWYILGIMVVSAGSMIGFFKWRRWI